MKTFVLTFLSKSRVCNSSSKKNDQSFVTFMHMICMYTLLQVSNHYFGNV